MTQSDLAQALGISQAAVSKLAKRGMPTDSVERASRWRRRHLQTGRMKGVRVDTIAARHKDRQPNQPEAPTPEDLDLFPDEDPEEARLRKFGEARERREHYAAEIAKLNYERECGKFLYTAEVITFISSTATELRNSLEQLPDQIAARLFGKDENQIAAELAAEVERTLETLSNRFAEFARTAGPTSIDDETDCR